MKLAQSGSVALVQFEPMLASELAVLGLSLAPLQIQKLLEFIALIASGGTAPNCCELKPVIAEGGNAAN